MTITISDDIALIKEKERLAKLIWSVKVRYIAIIVSIVIFFIARFAGIIFPIYIALVLAFVGLFANYLYGEFYKKKLYTNSLPYVGIIIDIVFITILVYFTGGLTSPFIFFYFLQIIGTNIHVGVWSGIWASLMSGLLFGVTLFVESTNIVKHYTGFIGNIDVLYNNLSYIFILTLSLASFLLLTSYITSYIASRLKIVEEELSHANLRLVDQNKRLKKIDRQKTEFVSVAAHQLRTPLSAIKWSLKIIANGEAGALTLDQKDLLNKAYVSNERMINLVNNLLDVARIEEGRFGYRFTKTKIDNIVNNVIEEHETSIQEKNLQLAVKWPSQPLPLLTVDKNRIRFVIQNLLDNAIKYTPNGGQVTIEINFDKLQMEIVIKDSGMGISKHQQKGLFSKFFRADNAVKTQTIGSGLGLYIAKHIIEKHGGTINFSSKENKGTIFRVLLPLKHKTGLKANKLKDT